MGARPLFQYGQHHVSADVILTSGSDLDRTADNAWPDLIPTEAYFPGDIVPNNLHSENFLTPASQANYGQEGGVPDWQFRNRPDYAYDEGAQAGMPGPIREPYRPTWQNLPPGQYWQRYVDIGQWDNTNSLSSPTNVGNPLVFQSAGPASLQESVL